MSVNDAKTSPSYATDDTDIFEDFPLGSFTLDATVSGEDISTVVSQRRIGLHRRPWLWGIGSLRGA